MSDGSGPRTAAFARNPLLDDLIHELASLLGPADASVTAAGSRPARPVVFVVGGPRSGSTLTMQALAASGRFAYPTNLLSRFASTPAIGARIQALLCDERFAYRDELADVGREIRFDSDLGKSAGALQPSEFWYFWRRFFPVEQPRGLTAAERESVDFDGFAAGLAAIEAVDGRPLALKAMLVMLDLDLLADAFPQAVFVDVRRHPYFQCRSILDARRRHAGDVTRWWSVEPPGVEQLHRLPPELQVAHQVHRLNQALDRQLDLIGDDRTVRMSYADLCASPDQLVDAVLDRMRRLGDEIGQPALALPIFESRDHLDGAEPDAPIIDAWSAVTGVDLSSDLHPAREATCT